VILIGVLLSAPIAGPMWGLFITFLASQAHSTRRLTSL
jgi:hypothetical protein